MPEVHGEVTGRSEIEASRKVISSRMELLMASGVQVGLHIEKVQWTAAPRPEEFGMLEFPEIFKPGRMMMLPDETLKDIALVESRARAFLDGKSHYSSSQLSGFRYVHIRHAPETILELGERRKQFDAAIDKLVGGYEEAKLQMRQKYFESWDKMKLDDLPATAGKREEFWTKRMAEYPTVEHIRAKYKFFLELTQTKFPEALESIDFRTVVRDQELNEEKQQRLEAEIAHSKAQLEISVTKFAQETVKELRGEVVKVFQDLQKKVASNEPLNKKNITAVRDIVNHVKEMDFLGDEDFKRQLDAVVTEIGGRSDYNDDSDAAKALAGVLGETVKFVTQTTETTAVNLTERYFSRKLNLN